MIGQHLCNMAEALLVIQLVTCQLWLQLWQLYLEFSSKQSQHLHGWHLPMMNCSPTTSAWQLLLQTHSLFIPFTPVSDTDTKILLCPTPDEWKGYYIDNDKIPGLFQWQKNNFYLPQVKISRLSWLLVSTNKRLILSWYFIYLYIINWILYVCLCIWILNFLYSTWTLEDKIHIHTLACDISKNK